MKRFIPAAFSVMLAWLVLAPSPAAAQNTYPYQMPRYGPGWQTPLSPYLLLTLPGNTAVNYYNLVQPQFQSRQYRNSLGLTLQGMLNQLPPPPGIMTEADLNAPMPATGHPTAFNYTGSYFSNLTGQPLASEGGFAPGRTGAGTRGQGRPGMMRGGMMGMGGMMGTARGMGGFMRPGMGMMGR